MTRPHRSPHGGRHHHPHHPHSRSPHLARYHAAHERRDMTGPIVLGVVIAIGLVAGLVLLMRQGDAPPGPSPAAAVPAASPAASVPAPEPAITKVPAVEPAAPGKASPAAAASEEAPEEEEEEPTVVVNRSLIEIGAPKKGTGDGEDNEDDEPR